jgi:uncharacterized protein (TIGR02246 family)
MANTNQALADELLALEHRYWQAVKDGDLEAAVQLTHDPCIVTGAQGVGSVDHKTYTEMAAQATWSLRNFRLDDPQVQLLGDDVAVLAYTIHEELTVEGEPVVVDAADASTWVRRDGRWLCALHTESILGDPFGRDRTAAGTRAG